MRTLRSIGVAAALAAGLFGATAAQAYPGHFYYGPRVGVFVDPWPAVYSGWGYGYGGYYPYYGYPPVVVTQPAAPTVYMEQGQVQPAAPAPAASNDWYYCRKPAGYYPYVRNCEGAWERVPAQPPQASGQ